MATLDEQPAPRSPTSSGAPGEAMAEWVAIVRASGLQKHGEMVAMLKADHGLGHGNANLIAIRARGR